MLRKKCFQPPMQGRPENPSEQNKKRNREGGSLWQIPLLWMTGPLDWPLMRKEKKVDFTHLITSSTHCILKPSFSMIPCRKGYSSLSKVLDVSSFTTTDPFVLESPRIACMISKAILSETKLPWVNAP